MSGFGLGYVGGNRRRGGGAASPTSTQWRLYFPSGAKTNSEGSAALAVREVQMRATIGGSDQCTGGTASASSEPFGASFNAAKAFDDTAARWETNAGAPSWLQYTFGSAVAVEEVVIGTGDSVSKGPSYFQVQYHDGSDWVTYFDSEEESFPLSWASTSEDKVIARSGDYAPAGFDRWRINITDGAPTTLYIDLMQLLDGSGNRLSYAGIAWTASSNLGASFAPSKAFDASGSSWVPNPQPGDGAWLEFQFEKPREVSRVSIKVATGQGANRGPVDFDLEYYDPDLASWQSAFNCIPSSGWTDGQTRVWDSGGEI